MMKRNVGNADRWIRIVMGTAVIAAGFYYSSWWGALGVIPLLTAGLGWCPAYVPFGISSCRRAR